MLSTDGDVQGDASPWDHSSHRYSNEWLLQRSDPPPQKTVNIINLQSNWFPQSPSTLF